ncbi:MAG: protoheme IX farnesyltransferase [bacterium]|nr:protoheme IX farnesyltransferase [bacterium]
MITFNELMGFMKYRIAILSTMSAVTGFVMAGEGFSWLLLPFIFAMFLLAGGGTSLNQCQEYPKDRLMDRTKHRVIPSGKLGLGAGLTISLGLITGGLLILYLQFGPVPALLGALALVLYNGMYTYLKRVTAFAAVPGALIGAVPPAIGWFAAGGDAGSPVMVGLVLFFFIWQIPHFWLLLGFFTGDYAKAGFPSLNDIFTNIQLARITFTWILATACTAMLCPLFGMFNHPASLVCLAVLTVWLGYRSIGLVKDKDHAPGIPVFRKAFMTINVFALLIMVVLIVDHGVLI